MALMFAGAPSDTIEEIPPRTGPRPLSVHIARVMAEYIGAQKDQGGQDKEPGQIIEGIRLYQQHPFRRFVPPLPVIWNSGGVSLRHCPASPENRKDQALLIVPSMINRPYILDLLPEKSFVRWLAQQGIDVFVVDWGEPVKDHGLHTMDSVVVQRLVPAMSFLHRYCGKEGFHALGYCMGGTILSAAAVHFQNQGEEEAPLRSISFLATPWGFDARYDDNAATSVAAHVRASSFSALQMISHGGVLPVDWVQSVFAAANTGRALEKFSDFVRMDQNSEQARLFVAVEDWLNDGLDMPGGVAQCCILDWYRDNKTATKKWNVAEQLIDLSRIEAPSLVIASRRDRLVPYDSSCAMMPSLMRPDLLVPDCGHIGMIAGRRAVTEFWEPYLGWLCRRQHPQKAS